MFSLRMPSRSINPVNAARASRGVGALVNDVPQVVQSAALAVFRWWALLRDWPPFRRVVKPRISTLTPQRSRVRARISALIAATVIGPSASNRSYRSAKTQCRGTVPVFPFVGQRVSGLAITRASLAASRCLLQDRVPERVAWPLTAVAGSSPFARHSAGVKAGHQLGAKAFSSSRHSSSASTTSSNSFVNAR